MQYQYSRQISDLTSENSKLKQIKVESQDTINQLHANLTNLQSEYSKLQQTENKKIEREKAES